MSGARERNQIDRAMLHRVLAARRSRDLVRSYEDLREHNDWIKTGLNVQIPRAVMELVIKEMIKQTLEADMNEKIMFAVDTKMTKRIFIPIANMLIIISILGFIGLLFTGLTVLSIPFALCAFFSYSFIKIMNSKLK